MAVHAPAPVHIPAPPPTSSPVRDLDGAGSDESGAYPPPGRAASPARVNPYHYVHHPGSDEVMPPLPPHLERLASGEAHSDDEDDSDTSDGEDFDEEESDSGLEGSHARRSRATSPPVAKKTPGPAAPATMPASANTPPSTNSSPDTPPDNAPRRIIKKMSSVFRRGDNNATTPPPPPVPPLPPGQRDAVAGATPGSTGNNLSAKNVARLAAPTSAAMSPQRRSPIMQGPPPSPPLSDASDEAYATSVAVTDATGDMAPPSVTDARPDSHEVPAPANHLMPVTEAGESKHALADHPPLLPPPAVPETPMVQNIPDAAPDINASPTSSVGRGRPDGVARPPVPPFMSQRRVSSGSTSSRAGSLSMVRSGRLAPQRDPSPVPPAASGSPELRAARVLPALDTGEEVRRAPFNDAIFASVVTASPVSASPPRPTVERRNTNPTTSTPSPLSGRPLQHSISVSAHAPSANSSGYDDVMLPADIAAQADVIRRERLERKQKKMSQLGTSAPAVAEASNETPTSTEAKTTTKRRETEETKVLVGNLVGEGHRNYVLMYNMLTGIRIAVSRCQAKIKRPVTDEDYLSRHKYSFDMLGNELTPSAKYDFKFKDYAPWVFRELREEHFHLDPADYLLSLTAKYILSEIGSPGKSGSFFYYSRDYRFIIKTISHSEHNFLRSILKQYHEHVRANPHTLLSRFYGLHRVKMPRGRKIHFVIMNNLFPPHRDIHETYDLKGSAYGREYPEDKAKNNPRAVLKDKNWVNRGRTFQFGPEKRALFTEQLRRDEEFLKRINVMDYSLLVGIHNMERGNRDNLRKATLKVFHPNPRTGVVHRKPSAVKTHAEASNMRRAVARSDPKSMLDAGAGAQLPDTGAEDRRHFIFYQDEGGMRATDEFNQPMDMIYYLGIIDICTPYNLSKRVEHAWKSMTENPVTISCVDPTTYGNRFLNFLMSEMRGGDISLRPPGLESPPKPPDTAVGTLNPPTCAPASHGLDPTVIAEDRSDYEANALAAQTSPRMQAQTPVGQAHPPPVELNPIATRAAHHPSVTEDYGRDVVRRPDGSEAVIDYFTEKIEPAVPDQPQRPPSPGTTDANGFGAPALVGHWKVD